jgi:predicted small secreted protein
VKRKLIPLLVVLVVAAVALTLAACAMVSMPGKDVRPLPALSPREAALAITLRADVRALAEEIGERNATDPDALAAAAKLIEDRLTALGYTVTREPFRIAEGGLEFVNLVAEVRGHTLPKELLVIGAHYDTAEGTPGADDNGSGVAALLALAESYAKKPQARTIRFVAFANEEPPYFQEAGMGSFIAARRWKQRGDDVAAMLSLETIGTFSDEEGSQQYPALFAWLYPTKGDFMGFVGDTSSLSLVHRCVRVFREAGRVPAEGAAVPRFIPGIDWSDHWSFWQQGWPALMVTTTAPYRNPRYHQPNDVPQHLDYERLARTVVALEAVVDDLATTRDRF